MAGLVVAMLVARQLAQQQHQGGRAGQLVLTKQELAQYEGAGGGGPLYLALLGEVFDVSSKAEAYGPGKGYHHFVGVDGSRAFLTGDFVGDLNDEVSDFDGRQCMGLVDWLDFYHKTYSYVGRLVGAFYDEAGEATDQLYWVQSQAVVGRQLKNHEAAQSAAYPDCNMQYSDAAGGSVWCEGGMYPRKLFLDMEAGQPTWRCACFKELGWSDLRQIYPGCDPDATRCQVAPPQ